MQAGTGIRVMLAIVLGTILTASCNDNASREAETANAVNPPGSSVSEQETAESGGISEESAVEESAAAAGSADSSTPPADSGKDILERHWQESPLSFRDPLSMNMELKRAEFNPVEGANMSILHFEASCQLGRSDWIYRDLVMDNLKSTESATLELDICSIELMPLLRNPVVQGRTSTGGTRLRMDGGLRFIVRDPDGVEMGSFVVGDGGMMEDSEKGEAYSWRISETDDAMMPTEYVFFRTPKPGEPIHYLFGVSYRHGSMARQVVNDPLGNEITYMFPNGSVQILPPNPPKRERKPADGEVRRE
ncbi:MAG: hypothetical protein R3F46_00800 [bacterium]